jgi:hypothetical protein
VDLLKQTGTSDRKADGNVFISIKKSERIEHGRRKSIINICSEKKNHDGISVYKKQL